MNKGLYLLALAVLILALAGCGKSADGEETADSRFYFTADEGGSITKIAVLQNKVVDTIKLDGAVHNVQVSPDGKIVGATLLPQTEGHMNHDGGETKGLAVFYNTDTNQLIKEVAVGAHPAHIVFTNDQKYALVSNNEDNNVTVIAMETYQQVKTIPTGKGPHGFRLSADSKYAYVANMGEDTVSVLDLASGKETKRITVGQAPVTTGVTTDGKQLVVPLNAENAVAIVDLAAGTVEKIPVGVGPAQVYIQSDNKVAVVANQGTEKEPSRTISKIDLESKKSIATIETGQGSHGVVISEDNRTIYVTNMFANTVSVVDNRQNKEIAEFAVGTTPNGISIMP